MKAGFLAALLLLQAEPETLPGTRLLEAGFDAADRMLSGIDACLDRELAAAPGTRRAGSRERLRKIIGAVDPRRPSPAFEREPAGRAEGYTVDAVKWPVLEGLDGEGILLRPAGKPAARVIALPDADVVPERFAAARRLAEQGCEVLVPVLIDRSDEHSGHPQVRFTNQPHREFVYRAAFGLGRHVIGLEVQKVLAAVDAFAREPGPIAVAGHGEGGLLALYAAALDTRIGAALVSGHFQEREGVWREPIYRNVWGLLREFGDAELAGLVAPRVLVVEAGPGPEVAGPPAPREKRDGAAPGRLATPPLDSVRREVERARPAFARVPGNLVLAEADAGLGELLRGLGLPGGLKPAGPPPELRTDPRARRKRQFDQLVDFTQRLIREAAAARERFWSSADTTSPERFAESTKPFREHLRDEILGRLPAADLPADPRTRKVYDEPKWRGYEAVLDVHPGVIAAGVLLVPKDLAPGERRPVVVCQHGSGGKMHETIQTSGPGFGFYKAFAARLADRGFVVFSPQAPWGLVDRFQALQRKANPLKLSTWSFVLRQHERALDWLASLPFVDPARIGFYGLSFGGKTAVRIPPVLSDRYALSICSADFTDWIRKTASTADRWSYMFTVGWSIYEFDLAGAFNYAELSWLMVPRPFMVERGRKDPVGPDEWVASEYAKVKALYEKLGIGDRCEIEVFDGPHTIHGEGTFAFLHRHLGWPPNR